jgi:hypothetical protein
MRIVERIDARGWIGIASFALTVMVLWMLAAFPDLRTDEFFKFIATAVVISGFVQGPIGWAFQATQQGGDLAAKASQLVEQHATKPQKVVVDNPPSKPVPTTDTAPVPAPAAPDEELPDYAR